MKTIKHIYRMAMALMGAAMLFSACVDKNEWEIDSSNDRLFRVTDASVSVDVTDATITWTSMPNTEYYIIELSKDSLYDDIEMGRDTTLLFGTDKSITKSPYVISGLEGNMKYYFRMKGMSETKESKWAYLEKWYFETKGEQIFTAPVASEDISTNSVTLRWTAGNSTVTHIILSYEQDGTPVTLPQIDLSATDIANGYKLVEGLEEGTTYTATIYNGSIKRGEVTFRTSQGLAEGTVEYNLPADADLKMFFDTVSSSNILLNLPAGSEYRIEWMGTEGISNDLKIPDNITSLTIKGGEGGTQAKIIANAISISSILNLLEINNIEYEGTKGDGSYFIDFPNPVIMSRVSILNCNVHTVRGFCRIRKTSTIDLWECNNCLIHNYGSYGFLRIEDSASTIGDVLLEKSSFYGCTAKGDLIQVKTTLASLDVNHCTFYKALYSGSRTYFVSYKEGAITDWKGFRNCIFGATGTESLLQGGTNPGNKTTEFCINSYATADCYMNTGYPLTGIISYSGTSTDLFTDPDNGDLSIKDNTFAGKGSTGDPRWW